MAEGVCVGGWGGWCWGALYYSSAMRVSYTVQGETGALIHDKGQAVKKETQLARVSAQ